MIFVAVLYLYEAQADWLVGSSNGSHLLSVYTTKSESRACPDTDTCHDCGEKSKGDGFIKPRYFWSPSVLSVIWEAVGDRIDCLREAGATCEAVPGEETMPDYQRWGTDKDGSATRNCMIWLHYKGMPTRFLGCTGYTGCREVIVWRKANYLSENNGAAEIVRTLRAGGEETGRGFWMEIWIFLELEEIMNRQLLEL